MHLHSFYKTLITLPLMLALCRLGFTQQQHQFGSGGTRIVVDTSSSSSNQEVFERTETSGSEVSVSVERNVQISSSSSSSGGASTQDPWLPMMPPMNVLRSVTTRCDRTRNQMQVVFEFQDSFDGFLYTKGYYNVGGCKERGNNANQVILNLRLDGSCGVLASGTDTDLRYSVVIVVMMEAEWEILQMMDAAYNVHCGFTPDKDVTIGQQVRVPMIGVTDLPITIPPLPECRMAIVPGTDPNVGKVTELVLGQVATMVFTLNQEPPTDQFDIFVYNCLAYSQENGRSVELLNIEGCPAQQKVIGHTFYSKGGVRERETLAYAHFKVFKFPEVQTVYFACQCRVCLENCQRPICPGLDTAVYAGASLSDEDDNSGRRRRRQANDIRFDDESDTRSLEQQLVDKNGIIVPDGQIEKTEKTFVSITVVPSRRNAERLATRIGPDGKIIDGGSSSYEDDSVERSGFAVSQTAFIIALVVLGSLLLLALLLACCLFFRNRQKEKKAEEKATSSYSGYSGYSDAKYRY